MLDSLLVLLTVAAGSVLGVVVARAAVGGVLYAMAHPGIASLVNRTQDKPSQ